MQYPIAIGLGSNLNDRLRHLRKAAEVLKMDLFLECQSSQVYESDPWGVQDQPNFLNAVIVGQTSWASATILHFLKSTEKALGRTQFNRWGPREIDLDLLIFGDEIRNDSQIKLPHPFLHERAFVLKPLSELWSTWEHPVMNKTIDELLLEASRSQTVSLFAPPIL